jgi:hypothetical protein
MSALREHACAYAARGWPVFPVKPRGKVPLVVHGLHDACTDPGRIDAWWSRWPDANIGVRTGDVFDALDVDGDEGIDELARLVGGGDDGELPPGPAVLTPGGGVHVYVAPTGTGNRARFAPGLDWRGTGGYVVAPPSTGANGRVWWWPDDDAAGSPLCDAPGWLTDLLRPRVSQRGAGSAWARSGRALDRYAAAAVDGECRAVMAAPVGARNDTLVRAAFSLGQLIAARALDTETAAGRLLGAALAVGLDEREARHTIASGLEAGYLHPRGTP